MFRVFGFLLFPLILVAKPLDVEVHAESALLMNADTGAVLFDKNGTKEMYPASITKIVTAAYALECCPPEALDRLVTAKQEALSSISSQAKVNANFSLPSHWLEIGATHMGIKKGEQLTLKDLLYGHLVASAGDASNVIAQEIGGTIPEFVNGMNHYVRKLGATKTHFCNPHGLHHPKHVTTAYDMALIAKQAIKHPLIREIASTKQYARPKTNLQEGTTLVQGNRLIRSGPFHYPAAFGLKTGYHAAAGHTIVAAAEKNRRTLIAVVLKCKERGEIFEDCIRLFEAAFQEPQMERIILRAGPQKHQLTLTGSRRPITSYTKEDVTCTYYPSEEPALKCFLQWDDLELPIRQDQQIGHLQVIKNEDVYAVVPLFAANGVEKSWSFRHPILVWCFKAVVILAIVALFLLFFLKRRR
ncbi:MAG: D-alanyl-D-alanine carboxypeptidase [Chlamydiia bacterium]|nr:D-alanyl-D-alanine carboxypeptidase [Chlamydiia bacterium]